MIINNMNEEVLYFIYIHDIVSSYIYMQYLKGLRRNGCALLHDYATTTHIYTYIFIIDV
jgi:hypothetical protein